ncbi:MAG: hypothetical protein AB7M12_02680 [Hyphomonadaceae bacterium]
MRVRASALLLAVACIASPAWAQRAAENATRAADDAFGVTIGNETIGLYSDRDTRGFSPLVAGNVRVEGVYFDMRGVMPSRVLANTTIRVGLSAQNYPFPAPTGIVDYALRPISDRDAFSSVLRLGPNEGYSVELDAERTIVPGKLGVSGGLMWRDDYQMPGDLLGTRAIGLVSRLRPDDDAEVLGFWGFGRALRRFNPFVFTAGAYRPPDVKAKYFGQSWSRTYLDYQTYGLRARRPLGENWSVNAGLFRHTGDGDGPVADLYLATDSAGRAATHLVTDEQVQHQPITSGEVRVSGVFTGERLRHTVHFSARGRHSQRKFGGAANVVLPAISLLNREWLDEPAWTYEPQSKDTVRQWSGGAQYQLAWRGLGEIAVGALQTDYRKVIAAPGGALSVVEDKPFFVNAAAVFTPTRRLAVYGSFTQGLEEAPIAPENAVNAQEAPPAIHTEQFDFGLRYAIAPQLRLVVGYFNVEKPYFAVDAVRVYRNLGDETHKGYEISLAGPLTKRLNVVAGAVLQKPEVTGEGVRLGAIGPKPVSQPETTLKLNLDYRTRWVDGLSVDAQIAHTGARAATTRMFAELGGRQLDAEAFTTVDLGMRYRFKTGAHASTFRAQVLNVFDDFAWRVYPSGAFYLANPRNFQISLATDF